MAHPPSGAPQRRRRRRDPRGTRDRLVRAAVELFTTQGYHDSTTPEIADRAGVAEGTIYRHFDSKEHLLNEIYRAAVRLLLKDVKEVPGSQPCRARLTTIAVKWRELAARDPALINLVFATRLGTLLDAKSRDTYAELKGELARILASGKAAGEVRAGPVEVWTEVWLSLVVLTLTRVADNEWGPQHSAPQMVTDAAWDAVQAGRIVG